MGYAGDNISRHAAKVTGPPIFGLCGPQAYLLLFIAINAVQNTIQNTIH